jgi:hypothetical protein
MFTFLTFWQALPAVLAITIFGITNLAKANLSKLVPVTDAVFHIFAYGGFTLVWIRFMNLYLPVRNIPASCCRLPPRLASRDAEAGKTAAGVRLLLDVGIPICFLLLVKAGSLLLGRHFAVTDLLFATLAIVAVATVRLICKTGAE